jgi:hypothetical protein
VSVTKLILSSKWQLTDRYSTRSLHGLHGLGSRSPGLYCQGSSCMAPNFYCPVSSWHLVYCSGIGCHLFYIVQLPVLKYPGSAATWFILSRMWLPPVLKYPGSAATWFILSRKWLAPVLKYPGSAASWFILSRKWLQPVFKYPGSVATWFILSRSGCHCSKISWKCPYLVLFCPGSGCHLF